MVNDHDCIAIVGEGLREGLRQLPSLVPVLDKNPSTRFLSEAGNKWKDNFSKILPSVGYDPQDGRCVWFPLLACQPFLCRLKRIVKYGQESFCGLLYLPLRLLCKAFHHAVDPRLRSSSSYPALHQSSTTFNVWRLASTGRLGSDATLIWRLLGTPPAVSQPSRYAPGFWFIHILLTQIVEPTYNITYIQGHFWIT